MKPAKAHSSASKLSKLLQYARLYGWRRSLVKAAGRGDYPAVAPLVRRKAAAGTPGISLLGCGQAAFSTICYYLARGGRGHFVSAFDPDKNKAEKLASFYQFKTVADSAAETLQNEGARLLYIASNHASHADYAVAGLQRGMTVFVEKPICTDWSQYEQLRRAAGAAGGRLFAGYNRPFAPAIRQLTASLRDARQPLSLSCYVHGHLLGAGHWYRRPEEGTRICGNAGHWLDLFVHLYAAVHGSLPSWLDCRYLPANPAEPDDNFSLSLRSPQGDIFQLMLTARSEPFEGIREQLEIQCGGLSASIGDFRRLVIFENSSRREYRHRHKDLGHREAVLQPFAAAAQQRDFAEVWCSTALMLQVADMARAGTAAMHIDLQSA